MSRCLATVSSCWAKIVPPLSATRHLLSTHALPLNNCLHTNFDSRHASVRAKQRVLLIGPAKLSFWSSVRAFLREFWHGSLNKVARGLASGFSSAPRGTWVRLKHTRTPGHGVLHFTTLPGSGHENAPGIPVTPLQPFRIAAVAIPATVARTTGGQPTTPPTTQMKMEQ
eukprot:3712708-Rhodomonas_salina.1